MQSLLKYSLLNSEECRGSVSLSIREACWSEREVSGERASRMQWCLSMCRGSVPSAFSMAVSAERTCHFSWLFLPLLRERLWPKHGCREGCALQCCGMKQCCILALHRRTPCIVSEAVQCVAERSGSTGSWLPAYLLPVPGARLRLTTSCRESSYSKPSIEKCSLYEAILHISFIYRNHFYNLKLKADILEASLEKSLLKYNLEREISAWPCTMRGWREKCSPETTNAISLHSHS